MVLRYGEKMKYTTVSAKIDTKLKEKIAKYNINVSKVIKKALEEEVRRREEEEIREMLKEASKILSKVGRGNIIQFIREGREER
jgi:post-segregation antitoxin (ccd killing protein)